MEMGTVQSRDCKWTWWVTERLVIDQFIAGTFSTIIVIARSYGCSVHFSSDGKHLVAMLSGSRIVIIPNFEAIPTRNSRIGISGHPAWTSGEELKPRTEKSLNAPSMSSSVLLLHQVAFIWRKNTVELGLSLYVPSFSPRCDPLMLTLFLDQCGFHCHPNYLRRGTPESWCS